MNGDRLIIASENIYEATNDLRALEDGEVNVVALRYYRTKVLDIENALFILKSELRRLEG